MVSSRESEIGGSDDFEADIFPYRNQAATANGICKKVQLNPTLNEHSGEH
jgi:hypothetical protein